MIEELLKEVREAIKFRSKQDDRELWFIKGKGSKATRIDIIREE